MLLVTWLSTFIVVLTTFVTSTLVMLLTVLFVVLVTPGVVPAGQQGMFVSSPVRSCQLAPTSTSSRELTWCAIS